MIIRLESNWLKLWNNLQALPAVKGAEGLKTIHSDGKTLRVLELRGGRWRTLASFSHEQIERYLANRRGARHRAERLRREAGCMHRRRKRRRCLDCGHVAEPRWLRCGQRDDDYHRCTRRHGHDGSHRFVERPAAVVVTLHLDRDEAGR
jgi:hypothetical protein